MNRFTRLTGLLLACATLIAVADITYRATYTGAKSTLSIAGTAKQPIHVMTIGGSVAHGWKDTVGSGYLPRAFSKLQVATHHDYHVYDRTIVGANSTQLATMYKGDYDKWFESVQPQIVVISWGLLNDAKPSVPYSQFEKYIRQEIGDALHHKAIVFLVTPPVTKASYTEFEKQEFAYARAEVHAARSFHSPNVYVFDVFDQMKSYLRAHNLSYVPYAADGWHPNTAGHILAGELLFVDMHREFNNVLPKFITS